MTLSDALASQVDVNFRQFGRNLYTTGSVHIQVASGESFSAQVHASAVFQVQLQLAKRAIFAQCSCGSTNGKNEACQHIWAAILAAETRSFAKIAAGMAVAKSLKLEVLTGRRGAKAPEVKDPEDAFEFEPVRPSQYSHPPKPPEPSAAEKKWTELLSTLERESNPILLRNRKAQTEVDRQLIYIFDAAGSESIKKLAIEVHVCERKVNGNWGKPKAKPLTLLQAEMLPDPKDRELFTLLHGADRSDSYGHYGYYEKPGTHKFRAEGRVLDLALPRLAEVGRVYLRRTRHDDNNLEPLTAELETPWELVLSVVKTKKGEYELVGGLQRGREKLRLAEADILLPGIVVWPRKFGRLENTGAFSWITTLKKLGSVPLPPGKSEELVAQLMAMPGLPKFELPEELKFAEEQGTPKPVLKVKPAQRPQTPPKLDVELLFDYDGAVLIAEPFQRGVPRSEGRRFLLRDENAERAAALELQRLGVRPRQRYYGNEEGLELASSQLPKLVRELTSAGWKVEADGKLYRQAGHFEMAVSSGVDWFDLNAKAEFDGQFVPFPRLLEALRRGDVSVPLDDGSYGMLPEEWLKKFGLMAQMGTVEGDAVRFTQAQVGILDALLATRPEIEFDKAFAKARDRLRKFTGVAPSDPPKGFTGELREYQREGLGWLKFLREFGFGGCLADDMGLGKTVQVLALLAGKRKGPALIVVPRSLIFNWKREAAKFAPQLKVLDHSDSTRDRTGSKFGEYDLILTTYGILRNDAEVFAGFHFDTCVLDESQAAKNAATETAKAVRVVRADHRLALSGTPVENHLGEIWTLFDFLNPGLLGHAMPTGQFSLRNPDAETREFLAKALKPFLLRRTKLQVAKDLPEKTENTVYCDLEPAQRQLYDELREHYRQSLLNRIETVGLAKSKIQVLEALLRLRQAACHPGLLDKSRSKETSAKLDVLLPQLRELAESGSKALVFSQFTSLLAIVRQRLDADGTVYEYLDGKTKDRQERVERFQTDPDCHLFLISLKAGGVGLNLTSAEYVFLLDPWWNPAVEAQAIDRSHRIGQTKPVFAYRLIARGTVEEKVLELQKSKRELADAILGGEGKMLSDLNREDLEMLLS